MYKISCYIKAKKGLQNIIAHDESILLMDVEWIEVKYDNGYLGVIGGKKFYFFLHSFSFFLNLMQWICVTLWS